MLQFDRSDILATLRGPSGSIELPANDDITCKMLMLIDGECQGLGPTKAAEKFGYTKSRYFQLLEAYREGGAPALQNKKRGPRSNYRRTDDLVRLVIRHRFLDSQASAEVIAQKINQPKKRISIRSVERIITDFGLQKKTLPASSERPAAETPDPANKIQDASRKRG